MKRRDYSKPYSIGTAYLHAVGWYRWFLRPHFRQLGPQGYMTCALCGIKDRHFMFVHIRRHKICNRHTKYGMNAPLDEHWRARLQVSLAQGVLTEIARCAT